MSDMRTELDRAVVRMRLADLEAARDTARAQMDAAWSYYIEAKASFSIAAGELALAEHRAALAATERGQARHSRTCPCPVCIYPGVDQ